jgi:hypothetical protein
MIDVVWMQPVAAGLIIGCSVASVVWTFITIKVQTKLVDDHTAEVFSVYEALGNVTKSRNGLTDILVERDRKIANLIDELVPLQMADARMRQQRAEAGRKGNAVATERRREKRKAAVAKTMAELGGTVSKMRSHAQVVAPVKAKRTRAKKAQSAAASA